MPYAEWTEDQDLLEQVEQTVLRDLDDDVFIESLNDDQLFDYLHEWFDTHFQWASRNQQAVLRLEVTPRIKERLLKDSHPFTYNVRYQE